MKKALIISYYFPPSGGAGVQRTLKFTRYLAEQGWTPVVLTVSEKADFPVHDPSLWKEVPAGVEVIRTSIIEPYGMYRRLTGRGAGEALDVATMSKTEDQRLKWSERFSEWMRRNFFIPDARVGWLPVAVAHGQRRLSQGDIQVIYSSGPPYTCHVIGLALRNIAELPWVADFRDSWVDWVSAPRRRGLARVLDKSLEGRVLNAADRILTVSPGVAEDLQSRHPETVDDRWVLLHNGFDGRDFEGVSGQPGPERMTITYTGSMYGPRNPKTLLRALLRLMDRTPEARGKIRLRIVGRVGADVMGDLQAGDAENFVEAIPYVSHRESIEYLLRSDVLLLIIDDTPANKGIMTGKLYEYLGAGRPVLCLAPEGDASKLIESAKAGLVAHPEDEEAVYAVVVKMWQAWQAGSLGDMAVNREVAARYDRRVLTGQLAGVLNDVLVNP